MFPSCPRGLSSEDSLPHPASRHSEFGRVRYPFRGPSPTGGSTSGCSRCEAALRCISGRTSYPRARLAFHRYPHLTGRFCSTDPLGPPAGVTRPSPRARVDRPASRPPPATKRPIRTRFRYGFAFRLSLAAEDDSPAHSAKGTQSGMD